jgi:hypothetical protein
MFKEKSLFIMKYPVVFTAQVEKQQSFGATQISIHKKNCLL